jgi:hypothetical protein
MGANLPPKGPLGLGTQLQLAVGLVALAGLQLPNEGLPPGPLRAGTLPGVRNNGYRVHRDPSAAREPDDRG